LLFLTPSTGPELQLSKLEKCTFAVEIILTSLSSYYINPPGVSHEEACVWGTKDKPIGNWSPYVAGANAADSGETFVKLGWNPIYIEPDVKFRDVVPDWGVRIEVSVENFHLHGQH
jgi:hypothetical protein